MDYRWIKREYKVDKLQKTNWCVCDPGFKPNEIDNRVKAWIPKEITALYSLSEKAKFKDCKSLRKQYDLFRYPQAFNYFKRKLEIKQT